MNQLTFIILITAAAGVIGTGAGGAIAAIVRKESNIAISFLLSFAAGVMLSVVCFDLMTDAIHPESSDEPISIFFVLFSLFVGYLAVFFLNRAIEAREAKQGATKSGGRSSMLVAGIVMTFAIALHNLPEGMVIGASFAGDAGVVLSRSGITMALVIGLHNIPEGMAVATPLIAGGMSRFRAIALTAISGLPTVIGAAIGYFAGTLGPVSLSFSLAIASGAMLYVVFGELLPQATRLWKSSLSSLTVLVGMAVGLIMVYA